MKTPLIFATLSIILSLWHIGFFILFIFWLIDLRARHQEYRDLIKQMKYELADPIPFIAKFQHTHCQRQVLVSAFKYCGLESIAVNTYYQMGYRWWHLLPAWFFKKPYKLFTYRFWKAFVGIKK